jgi:hypothetical protein
MPRLHLSGRPCSLKVFHFNRKFISNWTTVDTGWLSLRAALQRQVSIVFLATSFRPPGSPFRTCGDSTVPSGVTYQAGTAASVQPHAITCLIRPIPTLR